MREVLDIRLRVQASSRWSLTYDRARRRRLRRRGIRQWLPPCGRCARTRGVRHHRVDDSVGFAHLPRRFHDHEQEQQAATRGRRERHVALAVDDDSVAGFDLLVDFVELRIARAVFPQVGDTLPRVLGDVIDHRREWLAHALVVGEHAPEQIV